MREHLRKCGIHVFRKQIKAGGNGNIICFFARSIKNVECGVQRPVQIPGHCFVGTRNKICVCTDGTPNACSILYAAAYRAARAMGYNRVVTYILDTENGASLKAAGYICEGRAGGLEWNGAKAPKQADQYPRQMKTRWVKKKEGLHGS